MNNDPLINNMEEANGGYRPVHVLSQTDIKNEKIDLLYKFKKLNDQGVRKEIKIRLINDSKGTTGDETEVTINENTGVSELYDILNNNKNQKA